MESTSPVIDCEILRQMFSQHMCAGTLLNNVDAKSSQGGCGVSNELLAVNFSHLQFELIKGIGTGGGRGILCATYFLSSHNPSH